MAQLRAAAFVRLSRQSESSTSLEAQQADCEARIHAEGWAYDPAVDLYRDDNKSAYREVTRPEYARLWDELRAGTYDRVVVVAVGRFSRRWDQWGRSCRSCGS